MRGLLQDARYAGRVLRKQPGFTLAAVLTLALGLGANTAIFSVVNGVLLRPLPFGNPDRIAMVWVNNLNEGIEEDIASFPNFRDWRSQSRSFAAMAGFSQPQFTLTGDGEPEQLKGVVVTEEFFDVLQVRPALGRPFRPEEMEFGRDRVAVLGHGLWVRRFGSDRDVIGRTVSLNGNSYEIIGVMPAGREFPADAELWTPLALESGSRRAESRGSLWLSVVGRLRPGVTLAEAQSEMTTIARRLEEEFADANRGLGIKLERLHDHIVGDLRPTLLVLLGAVGLVLLIACANVASLLLARGAARQKELAVRAALGAGRGRVMRQVLTESVVLGLVGGPVGVLLSMVGVWLLVRFGPAELPRLTEVSVDWQVLAFAFGVSLLTGLLFGLAPALNAARGQLARKLGEGGRAEAGGASLRNLRPVLVAAEVALALMLLVGAGLLVRSFARLQAVEPGFRPEGLLSLEIQLPVARYPDPQQAVTFYEQLLEGIEGLPGARSAAGISTLFLSRLPNMSPINVEGREPSPADADRSVPFDAVTPGIFQTLGVPLLSGRAFSDRDADADPVSAIVNQAFARRFFPGEDPLGRRITYDDPSNPEAQWYTIVGVVGDIRRSGLAQDPRPELYFPHRQFTTPRLTLVVRAAGDPMALVEPIRDLVARLDPQQPITTVRTVDQLLSNQLAERRFVMLLLVLFAAVAASLAAVGIYGVMAYLVSRRTRELGIRIALGAHGGDVLRMLLRQSLAHVLPGLLLGLVGAVFLTRVLAGQLYGVSALDPLTFAAVAALLTLVALLASYFPARRAARVDPIVALRTD